MNIHFEEKNENEHLIVFVHGLQGNKESFFQPDDKNFFHEKFDQSILNQVDIGYLEYHTEKILSKKSISFLIYKIFGFTKKEPIQNLNIEELSTSASDKIEKVISQYESVNFICHSMGGLVIKGVLIKNENILDKTNFYITLATPHRGTNRAKFLNGINRQVKSLEENSQIIKYLTENYLQIKDKLNRHYYRATDESWVLPKENAFPIFESMHTSPVECSHEDIAKLRFNLYLEPLIHDINKKIKNYLSLNKIILKNLYTINTQIKFTKTSYLRGLQCIKSLWLNKYKQSVFMPSDNTLDHYFFEKGQVVHDLASKLFPNGKKVSTKNFKESLYLTKQYIEQGISNIFEASFNYDGILIIVDILSIDPDGVSIYEVKGTTSVREDLHIHDVSIQYYVLHNLGFNIKSSNIIHLNPNYIRESDLDINKLFSVVDISKEVLRLQSNIPNHIKDFEKYLKDKVNEPDIEIGKYCNNPYICDAKQYCWKHIPEYSVFNLSRLNSDKKFELYKNNIIDIKDIKDLSKFSIIQQQQIKSEQSKKEIVNKKAIEEFLAELTYPLYYLDFETFQQTIPEWKGISPYKQIPYQYSIHIEQKNGSLAHKEFLAIDGKDPRYEIAKKLIEDIPTDVTVLTYNMVFEKRVIKELAAQFNELSYHLMSIHDNITDLITPFAKKDYYVPAMKGSYSIKNVLPALVPEMEQAYQNLDLVHNGGEAMQAFSNLSMMDGFKKKIYRQALLKYCKLDTLAMVKILEKLKDIMLPINQTT